MKEPKRSGAVSIVTMLTVVLLLSVLVQCKNKERQLAYRYLAGSTGDMGSCMPAEYEPFATPGTSNAWLFRGEDEFREWEICYSRSGPIDFSRESLILIYLEGTGCEFHGELKEVLVNEAEDQVRFVIEAYEKGGCLPLYGRIWWIVVEAIPLDSEVILEIHRTRQRGW